MTSHDVDVICTENEQLESKLAQIRMALFAQLLEEFFIVALQVFLIILLL